MDDEKLEEKIEEFTTFCHKNGLNVTYQRLAIYRVLLEAEMHISPEQIFKEIKKTYPNISLATIYKTLDVFREHNLIRKVNDIFQVSSWDIRTEPHHYMVCRKCKKLIDVPVKEVSPISISDRFKAQFEVEEVTVFFRGVCEECRKNEGK